MSTRRDKGPARSTANMVSLALFGLAAILFIAVAVLYVRDERKKDQTPPPPSTVPGHAQLKNVVDALKEQGIEVEYSREVSPRFENLTPPGQGLTVDGNPLYVFIYEDPAIREEETADLGPADLVAANRNGTPVAGDLHTAGGSNIYVILVGGDAELAAKVDRAIQGLP